MAIGGGTTICKKYLKYKDISPEDLAFSDKQVDEPIWVFWNKGMDDAPDIVKVCYRSLLEFAEREVILLTDDNIKDYIRMPKSLEIKLKIGVLPLAIYTDLMRMALLEHYGGTWVDSTIYLTENIPSKILDSEFFVFHNSLGRMENPVLYPVWFIHASQHNRTIREIRNILFAYWQRNNHVPEYLFSNIVITQVLKQSPQVEKNMPYLNSDYSEHLVRVLGDEYTEVNFAWIKGLTGIHKLTYKLDASIDKEGTVYHHIVHGL
ncbi:capsular polysaccharide synthesis protein [Anaerostipes faecalis]|uniref:capsular polysaccharide synthesis protein n=1 Tax=Anaerostipes faecalis TaxID=2738446 RepID=UPI003F069AEC